MVALEENLKLPVMRGSFYLVFQSLIVDLFGLYVLIGVAACRACRSARSSRIESTVFFAQPRVTRW